MVAGGLLAGVTVAVLGMRRSSITLNVTYPDPALGADWSPIVVEVKSDKDIWFVETWWDGYSDNPGTLELNTYCRDSTCGLEEGTKELTWETDVYAGDMEVSGENHLVVKAVDVAGHTETVTITVNL